MPGVYEKEADTKKKKKKKTLASIYNPKTKAQEHSSPFEWPPKKIVLRNQ